MEEQPESAKAETHTTNRMPPWVVRAILTFYGVAVALWLGYWVIQKTKGLLIMLLVSLFLSFALEPVVDWMDRRGVPRGVGTLISFLGLIALIGLFILAIGQLLTDQVVTLIDRAPSYITTIDQWAADTFGSTFDTDEVLAEFNEGGRVGELATALAPQWSACSSNC